MKKVKSYSERRKELFGATLEEELTLIENALDELAERVNGIIGWINKSKKDSDDPKLEIYEK